MTWPTLPTELRARLEACLGSAVVASSSQHGGFSPGSADRVLTSDGSRAFIKAVNSHLNEGSACLHAREAKIAALLPSSLPVAEFIGYVSWNGWEALIFADIDGDSPALPWKKDQLELVLDAVSGMAEKATGRFMNELPTLDAELREDFQGFARMLSENFVPSDPWIAANMVELNDLALCGATALSGNQLVHSDLRSDNLLINSDSTVVLIDWPWASRGAAWYDGLTVLIEARIYSPGFDVDHWLGSHELFNSAKPEAVNAVLAGLAGFYVDAARRPPIPTLPTLREYHAKQAAAAIGWLKQRLNG